MKAPTIARLFGVLFLLVGALGFVPPIALSAPVTAEYLTLGGSYAFVFGLFPVNAVHDGLHILFGVWGLAASFGFAAAVRYLRVVTWVYLLLAILGLIPITNTLFGAAPIYGHDIWLHFLAALVASYGAYGAASIPPPPEEVPA